VFGVSWFESVAYCRWLGEQLGVSEEDQCYATISLPSNAELGFFNLPDSTQWPLDLGKSGFRLLTEAEWERVCRSGASSAFSFGNDPALLQHYGWFEDNSEEWSHSVGRLRPNRRGLFDGHGNLFERCHDWYEGEYYGDAPADDPPGPSSGSSRVSRGGSWSDPPRSCRSAYRYMHLAGFRANDLGFRLALSPSVGAGPASQASGAAGAGRSAERAEPPADGKDAPKQ
jgi:formylglycine-generating enzyme required for sulfatase activity